MKKYFALMLALPVGMCSTTGDGPISSVSDYCQIAKPVLVSRADTRSTKEQADRELRKYKSVCGPR
jgi:hypothetical protein